MTAATNQGRHGEKKQQTLALRRIPKGGGCGSKLSHQRTAGFTLCFHLPGFHFEYIFSTHSQVVDTMVRPANPKARRLGVLPGGGGGNSSGPLFCIGESISRGVPFNHTLFFSLVRGRGAFDFSKTVSTAPRRLLDVAVCLIQPLGVALV